MLKTSIYNKFEQIPHGEWESLLEKDDFFLSNACLKIIEAEHENEIEPIYIIIKDKELVVGVLYAQMFKLSSYKIKDYINNSNPEFNLLRKLKMQLAELINIKVCFLGNLFLTNEIAYRFHPDYQDKIVLQDILNQVQTDSQSRIVLIPESFENHINLLQKKFKQILVEPDMHLKISEDWNTFDDYIDAVSSKYKKRYRKIIANCATITKKELSLSDLKHYSKDLKSLFDNVYYKSSFNSAKFNTDVFYDLKLIDQNVSVFGYFIQDKIIGFSSYIRIKKTLYAHFVGFDYELSKKNDLYSKMLFEQIQFAIENKIDLIKFGRTASEFKSNFGAAPQSNKGFVYDQGGVLLCFLNPLLKLLKPKDWIQRNPFKEVHNHQTITSSESATSQESKVPH